MQLHPDFPVVEGHYQMTDEWALSLAEPHNRRVEDGSLVLWRPGFTAWINIWGNDNNQTIEERATWLREEMSPEAFEIHEAKSTNPIRIEYRLNEITEDGAVYTYNGFVIVANSYVQISIYFDSENELSSAKSLVSSIGESKP